MRKYILLFLGFFAFSLNVFGQHEAGGASGFGIDISNIPGGYVSEVNNEYRGPEVVYAYYYEPYFQGDIFLKDAEVFLEGVSFRYETLANYLEISTENGKKGLPMINVDSFYWYNPAANKKEVFYNGLYSKDQKTPITGVYKVVEQGVWSLLEQNESVLKEPNYNRALDMGTNKPKVFQKKHYFLYNSKTHELVEVPRSRRKLVKQFSSREISNLVKKYVDEQDFSTKNVEDLQKLVRKLNS